MIRRPVKSVAVVDHFKQEKKDTYFSQKFRNYV